MPSRTGSLSLGEGPGRNDTREGASGWIPLQKVGSGEFINRRTLLAALLLPIAANAAPPPLSPQDAADVGRVEAFLNNLHTLKARFEQIAPDGRTSGGMVWLQRPGRMRFQYDPPSPFLLVAGYGLLVFHDAQLNQTSNIPLGRTPVGLLLQDPVKLIGQGITVQQVARYPGQLQVTMYRTATPGEGNLTLVFADGPLTLRSWIVVDAQRQQTRVMLYDVQFGGTFDSSLFSYVDPGTLR